MLISLTHSSFKGIYLNLKKTAFYFFLLIAYNGYSQASINYSTVQGLPSNEVYDIHQDTEGFLWFATDNGVVRYDGLQFKIFHAKDGLSDPVVFSFYEDLNKRIWFRTYSGRLSFFDLRKDKITTYEFNDKIAHYFKKGSISSLCVDSLNTLYIAILGGVIKINQNGKITTTNFPPKSFMYQGFKNGTLLGYYPKDLKIETAIINGTSFPIQLSKAPANHVVCSISMKGKLLFSIGVDVFEYKNKKIKKVFTGRSAIISLSKDKNADIWVGYLNSGAEIIDSESYKRSYFNLFRKKSITKVLQDKENGYWFSTLEDGVFYIPNKSIDTINYPKSPKTRTVIYANHAIVSGDQNGRLHFFDPKIKKEKKSLFLQGPVMSVFQDSEHKLWVSTNTEVWIIDSLNKVLKKIRPLSKIDFSKDGNKYIWGTGALNTLFDIKGNVVNTFNSRTYRSILAKDSLIILSGKVGIEIRSRDFTLLSRPSELKNIKIRKIDHLNDSTVLLLSIGNGPIIFNPYKGTFDWLVTTRNFPADDVYANLKTDSALWLGTEKGVFKINIKDLFNKKTPFQHLSKLSGLIDDKVNFMVKVERDVWVYSDNGISIIPLTHKEFDNQNPKFYIMNLLINNKKFEIDSSQHIELLHKENYIRLEVGFISFNNQDIKIRFRVSENDEWSYTSNRSVEFFSLSPGTYSINLEFSTDSIFWTPGIRNLVIYIKPPWWGIWYFQLIIGLLLVSWITFFALTRISLIKQKQIHLQSLTDHQQQIIQSEIESIEKERSRIAKDLHDGIGTTLTSIKMRVNQVLNTYNPPEANTIENRLQEVLREVKNIIHDLAPPTLMQFGLHEGLRNYIEKISTGTDIQIKLNIFGEELKDPKVNLFIFRITQELVVNSLKHANARNVTIHISTFSDLMNILYQDDGNGFLNEEITRGHGLYNIESRIRSLNGKILFETSSKGVSYSIDIPLL